MAKYNLLELNVAKLFEERTIHEIIELEKLLDADIERKRMELRSMVGDRYKDILTATDAIKSMEYKSENIVENIQRITGRCESLLDNTSKVLPKKPAKLAPHVLEERTILIQIRLMMELNENIWRCLDDEEYCKAAEFYLLAQHLYTGLRLLSKDIFERYKILLKLKATLDMLRGRILDGANSKLKTVEINTEVTCSNLNALMLLENYTNSELLNMFIELRKNALKTVIETTHSSVRAQISAMVKCLYTTVNLLYNCFLNYNNTTKGLIWHQLDAIISEDSLPTLSKITLPQCTLLSYIPKIILDYRPKCANTTGVSKLDCSNLIQTWLENTSKDVQNGLQHCLEHIPNINGLHIIREEVLKIDIPADWDDICKNIQLPKNFNIWYHFFQTIITNRAVRLIQQKIAGNINELNDRLRETLNSSTVITEQQSESDLRWYIWQDSNSTGGGDCNRNENMHVALAMKTKGYSPIIVELCQSFDERFLLLMQDVACYMYGDEYHARDEFFCARYPHKDVTIGKKFIDRDRLEACLKQQCNENINHFVNNLKRLLAEKRVDLRFVTQSILSARLLSALTALCPNFAKCCACNYASEDWDRIRTSLNTSSIDFWMNWVEYCVHHTETLVIKIYADLDPLKMLKLLCKWDTIEIQEQTDEKVFKSEIKVPMKVSIALSNVLNTLSEMINAILPHTLPQVVHLQFIERNTKTILQRYQLLAGDNLNQTQALQFLFDVKFLNTLCIPRENMELIQLSQDIANKFRALIDPFDLDVFYKYLQHNVRQNVLQCQMIMGCLLPSPTQLAALGVLEKNKEHEKDPSIMALSTPATSNWFSLLPVTAPVQKPSQVTSPMENKPIKPKQAVKTKRPGEGGGTVRSGAAALFGAMTPDWFS